MTHWGWLFEASASTKGRIKGKLKDVQPEKIWTLILTQKLKNSHILWGNGRSSPSFLYLYIRGEFSKYCENNGACQANLRITQSSWCHHRSSLHHRSHGAPAYVHWNGRFFGSEGRNQNMDASKNRGGPPKWMVKIMENPIKMDDLGVPLFLETPISWYTVCNVQMVNVGRIAVVGALWWFFSIDWMHWEIFIQGIDCAALVLTLCIWLQRRNLRRWHTQHAPQSNIRIKMQLLHRFGEFCDRCFATKGC